MSKILRLRDVKSQTGLSRSSIYAFIQKGEFPKPIKLGPKASGWLAEEVQEWINNKLKQRG